MNTLLSAIFKFCTTKNLYRANCLLHQDDLAVLFPTLCVIICTINELKLFCETGMISALPNAYSWVLFFYSFEKLIRVHCKWAKYTVSQKQMENFSYCMLGLQTWFWKTT